MSTRWRRLVKEVLRFLAVGGVATVVAIVLFNFLVHGFGLGVGPWLHEEPVFAYVLANLVGMAISYQGTRAWAFSGRDTAHPDGGVTVFLVINVATMMIPVACLWISRNLLGLDDPISDNLSANVIGLFLAMSARFVLFRHLVWAQPSYRPSERSGPVTDEATGRSTRDRAAGGGS